MKTSRLTSVAVLDTVLKSPERTLSDADMSYLELGLYLTNLQQLDIKNECLAIRYELSPEYIVTMLALLRAGISFICLSSDSNLISIKPSLDKINCRKIISKNNNYEKKLGILKHREKNNFYVNKDVDTACLILTSGSTGKPKLVPLAHKAVQRLNWIKKTHPLDQKRTSLSQFSPTTLGGILISLTPLVCGSKLALCPKEKIVDIEGFKKFSIENKITDIVIMPSLIKLLLEFEYDFSKIKEIFITGEHCDEETIKRLKAQRSRMKIFSLYGQSECAGHALSVEQGQIGTKFMPVSQALILRQSL